MTYMKSLTSDLIVVGAGPAGLMTASAAALRGAAVTVLDPNPRTGKKLRITGKGRCNLCNDCDVRAFLKNVPGNAKFLYSALNRFSPADTMAFFEALGVPLKTERGNRVFPVSDNAHDVARALEAAMKRAGVRLLFADAEEIVTDGGAVCAVKTSQGHTATPGTSATRSSFVRLSSRSPGAVPRS